MNRAHAQQRLTKAESNQKTRRTVTNAAERRTAIGEGPSQSPSLKVISANNGPLDHLLYLQGVVGNRAVGRLLQAKLAISQPGDPYEREADRVADTVMRMSEPALVEGEEAPVQTKPLTPQITPLVQRASAQLPEEEAEKGVATSPLVQRIPVAVREDEEEKVTPELEPGAKLQEEETPVQAKLETDAAIHRQAKQDEEPVSASSSSGAVQRFCAACAGAQQRQEGKPPELAQRQPARYQLHDDHDEAGQRMQPKGGDAVPPPVQSSVAANIRTLTHGGSPLPQATRAFFEPRFGADFSQVRVHTDDRAAETANSIQARAFTVGRNIAFGTGQYAPQSHAGRQVLAHELTHVVQQNGSQVQRTQPRATAQAPQAATSLEPDAETKGGAERPDKGFRSSLVQSVQLVKRGLGQGVVLSRRPDGRGHSRNVRVNFLSTFHEARFGHDFSQVRIHDDSESAAVNRQLRARAFTVGNHAALAAGELSRAAPASPPVAHEFAHVVQQRQAGVAKVMPQRAEEEKRKLVAPPCPGSCHVHVEHYERAFGDRGAEPLPDTFLERKQVPLSQQELQTLYDWIARSKPGTVSRVGPSVTASNELTGGPLKADVAAEYAKHEAEFRAKPNNRVQIIRFEVPAESDPDWPKYRASEISADQKKKTFASLGLRPEEKIFPRSVTSKDFSAYIEAQNANATVFGIIVQLPTPPQLRSDVGKIAAAKDLDALSASTRRSFRAPATAEGVVRVVLAMLKPGQSVAVIGGGRAPGLGALGFVGGAVVELLRERGITVKVFEKGDDLKEVKKYDLVVSAVGTPRVVQKEHLKPEHELVVDTGFVPEKGGKVVGDVEESARSIPRYITAVPGGTGPIEMAVLMERAAKLLGIKARSWQVELRDGKLRAVFIE